jgi:hypothetical protein
VERVHATVGWTGPKQHSGLRYGLLPSVQKGDRWSVSYNSGICKPQFARRPFRLHSDSTVTSMHAACWCTERAALERRVFVQQTMTEDGLAAIRKTSRAWLGWFQTWDLQTLSREEAVKQLNPSKRRRYEAALLTLNKRELDARDARVSMFVKADKLDCIGEDERKARAIQGREATFNLEFARFMKPIEHKLMGWKGPRRGVVRSRIFAKGLNNSQRAKLIIEKSKKFKNPVVVCVDASAWDASVTHGHLKVCHSLYQAGLNSASFAKLLKYQLLNWGKSHHGHEYLIKGNRMSGDMDTGIGNSLLNILVFATAMSILKISKWDFLCDGDDALVFVEDGALNSDELSRVCKDLGFCLTGGPVNVSSGNYWDIEFCRSHPIWTPSDGWIMCRNMQRAIDCFGFTHRYAHVPVKAYLKFLAGCGICELTCSSELPMIGPLSWRASMLTKQKIYGLEERWRSGVRLSDNKLAYTVKNNKQPVIHPRTRAQVAMAFNISIEAQLYYEETLPFRFENLECEVVVSDGPSGDADHLYTVHQLAENLDA